MAGTTTTEEVLAEFAAEFKPLEKPESLLPMVDKRTGASYCECHILGSTLIALGTTDVPLDPEDQGEYRANREIRENHPAFARMKEDAKLGRAFSNIVAEYTTDFDEERPLKIVGGQHRFEAIDDALAGGVDEYHGIKVYFNLDIDQRLDVQLISNTNIAISSDLFDRMQETSQGPELRNWCQKVGLLQPDQDFADQYARGGPISVRMARTFITNYFRGRALDIKEFDTSDTTPVICLSGANDPQWEALKARKPSIWEDAPLAVAGYEFAQLVAQKAALAEGKQRGKPDYPEKALNAAIYSAWAFIAGHLQGNKTRLERHFALKKSTGKDPLNAAALAKGRHKTDAGNYRGLGYRTDARERARFVELFYLQAENGDGIATSSIDIAIKQYHAKQAHLDVLKAKAR